MAAKKLMNQKNYIMKHNKISEMEIEQIKKEMQTSQRSHPAERKEEMLLHSFIHSFIYFHSVDPYKVK